jgi:lantibiotic modifying enzyme
MVQQATTVGVGAAWPLPDGNGGTVDVNDIVSGTAGAGLGLLYLDRTIGSAAAVETAVQAGHRLVEVGIPAEGGLKWKMSSTYERLMPNFSHGTAGICFFLASLSRHTGRPEFLDAALQGAEYLKAIATMENDGYLIFHNEPLGEDLFYLAWCHGPVGTNRLFYELARATDDASWMEWVEMGARGIMNTGVPETRTAGFWNNVSQCGGSAGIGDFFLTLHRLTQKPEYLEFVRRLNDDLFQRVTRDAPGMKWTQSEHRVQPDLLVAQTGFMQGAAGIGKYLLYMDAMEQGGRPAVTLPDSPFGEV